MLLCLVIALMPALGCGEGEITAPAGDTRIIAILTEEAAGTKDVWVQAILDAGVLNEQWTDNTVTFEMRSFNPKLKELGAYAKAEDQSAWRTQAMENIRTGTFSVTLTFDETGTPEKKSVNAMMKDVKAAAKTAKAAFGKSDMVNAIRDMLFPSPTSEKKATAANLMAPDAGFTAFIEGNKDLYPGDGAQVWSALFYLQRNFDLRISDGPHAMKLKWDGVKPSKLLDQSYDAAMTSLAGVTKAERAGEDSLGYLWRSTLAETAVTMKKGRLTNLSAEIDIDDLAAGTMPADYTAYIAEYTHEEYYKNLTEAYAILPDEAAQEIPKSGVITSVVKKGRSVVAKVSDDGRYTYVQLRDADTDVIQSDAFIRPGDSVTLRVPEGTYNVMYACGATWYGTEGLFGATGTYTKSNDITVAKAKWRLNAGEEQDGITLSPATIEEFAPTVDKSVHVEGALETDIELQEYPENNPVIEGVSSTTGLAASGEAYTPVVMVLDNAEDAYPHWGVSQADIIFQIPNAGSGATKLLALFADHYPEQAGPVRSGRVSMLPVAMSFDAAFAFAGPPAVHAKEVDLLAKMEEYRMARTHRQYNLLNSNGYAERVQGGGGHNLSCHIAMIHQNMIDKAVEVEERPFLFTDEKRADGETANIIRVLHRGEDPKSASNSASRAVFKYDAETGEYTRTNSSGLYSDRTTGETVTFANVIVLRVKLNWVKNYVYLKNHLTGSGVIEIFQDGKYVRGAWSRADEYSRLVLVDADGSELELKRGKTFIVITNDVTDVIYSE